MARRREFLEIVAGLVVLAGLFLAVRLFVSHATQVLYFGLPAGAVWSNLIASVICVAVAWWRIRTRMIAHHAQALAQAARHHREQLEQADVHHKGLEAQARTQHGQALAQAARQHEAQLDVAAAQHQLLTAQAARQHAELKAHVTASAPQNQPQEPVPAVPPEPGPAGRAKVRSKT